MLACTLVLQWFVYDDWLHQTGPVRLVGSTVAATLTFVFIFRWQSAIREREAEMLRRFETIAEMKTAFAMPCRSSHALFMFRTRKRQSTFDRRSP